jgi:hypothetical protein
MANENQSHKINSAGTAAVAESYYWMPCGPDTPIGVKLQLLGAGGVAIYGMYNPKVKFYTHWAPLPRRRHGEASE